MGKQLPGPLEAADPLRLAMQMAIMDSMKGWYLYFFHDMFDGDTEMRKIMRESALRLYARIVERLREDVGREESAQKEK